MRKTTESPGGKIVKDIKHATRKKYSSAEKNRIVLNGLRGEDSIAELWRREGRRLCFPSILTSPLSSNPIRTGTISARKS